MMAEMEIEVEMVELVRRGSLRMHRFLVWGVDRRFPYSDDPPLPAYSCCLSVSPRLVLQLISNSSTLGLSPDGLI